MSRLDPAKPIDRQPDLKESGGSTAETETLSEAVRNLTHELLIARDVEFGLRAEILNLEHSLRVSQENARETIAAIKRSRTWRLGRVVGKPFAILRPRREGHAP